MTTTAAPTAQGVTEDRIKVVAYLPNEEQLSSPTRCRRRVRAANTHGTHEDGLHDYLVPQLRFYETWGRDLEAHFYTSGGTDEQAQRADIVAIKAMKPFAAVMISSGED